jgi:hypothetical protein
VQGYDAMAWVQRATCLFCVVRVPTFLASRSPCVSNNSNQRQLTIFYQLTHYFSMD